MAAKENPDDDGTPAASNALPAFTARRVGGTEEWIVTIDGCHPITVTTATLHSNKKFIMTCMHDLARCFAPMKAAAWNMTLDTAMQSKKE